MTGRTDPSPDKAPERFAPGLFAVAYLVLTAIAMAAWIVFLAWMAWRLVAGS